jgi:predicted O-linked N-acetylglucosamine transferase (SPINDLY family)
MTNPERQKQQLAAGWQAIERNDARAAENLARAGLADDRTQIEFVRLLGASLFVQERYQEALAPFREVFQKARTFGVGYHLGYCYLALKDPGSASEVLGQVVREFPQMALAHNLLGISLVQQSRHAEALPHFAAAIGHAPQLPGVHTNLGNALSQLGRPEEALPHFEKATQLDPADPQARNNLGNALFRLRRTEAAIASYRKAVELAPDYPMALANLAAALVEENRHDEALACSQKAVGLDPSYADAHVNMGLAYQGLDRFDEAIASHQRALALDPDHVDGHANLGMIYRTQGRHDEAIARLERAVAIDPAHVGALLHLGAACQERGRLEESVGYFRKAIALEPMSADAQHNLGIALQGLARHDEAIPCFREALKIDREHKYTLGALLWSELLIYRWDTLESETGQLRAAVRQGKPMTEPFTLISVSENLEEQRLCGARFYQDRIGTGRTPLWSGERYGHEKIRVAYLSADFREHAVAYCMAEVLELHDRSKFEVIGASFGIDDGSALRTRLLRSFDRFLDLRPAGDRDAAKLLRDAEVDIAVDLMGYTIYSRPGILAHRPAPIQVGYLGYPGTVGADFLDYILADRFVIPDEHQAFYSEKIAYLPDSYQANDAKREIGARTPSRAEAGLPERGFVFCCFNNSYKIVPRMFGIWMRLLAQVPGSVLWVLDANSAGENLRKEAQARGVDPGRLVLAPRVGIAEYRARCRLADLFLDTLPYNGHGTNGDMLWSGLPVLSCAGRTFAGRVAGSLLRAAGLPELVTSSLEEYEAKALELARDEPLLEELRGRLARNRTRVALFDSDRFRRHLESAYRTMWETRRRGEPPRTFDVEPIA